jgi:hypothetical protein
MLPINQRDLDNQVGIPSDDRHRRNYTRLFPSAGIINLMLYRMFLLSMLFLFSACQLVTPTATRVPTKVSTLNPMLPTWTPPVSPTPVSNLPTPSLIPTFGPNYSLMKVASYAFLSGYRFMLTFEAPFVINGEYYALVNENSALPYPCERLSNNARKLRCIGPLQRVGDEIKTGIYPIGSKQPVFETMLIVEIVPFVVPK